MFALADELRTSAEALAPYFTCPSARPQGERYAGAGVRVRYFGHASVLIETSQTAVLVDPSGARRPEGDNDHFCLDDLPPWIDALFLSHGHQDHLCPEALLRCADGSER